MNKNSSQPPTTNKIFEDAAKKLQLIEKKQKAAEKYFKERENNEAKLKLIESNLKKKVKSDKRSSFGLEERTAEKLQNLLRTLSTVDLSLLNLIEKKGVEKISTTIQTDGEDSESLNSKLIQLEKENEKNLNKRREYKSEIEIYKSEIENLKTLNEKITKENKLLQDNLEEMTKSKKYLESKLKEFKSKNEELITQLNKSEVLLKEYEELKQIMEEKLEVEKENIELEENNRTNILNSLRGNLKILPYLNILSNVTKFLEPKDLDNLKCTSRVFYESIEKDNLTLKNYYRSIILKYKQKVNELDKMDMRKEYLVNDTQVEKFILE